jgi:hypothetical protein
VSGCKADDVGRTLGHGRDPVSVRPGGPPALCRFLPLGCGRPKPALGSATPLMDPEIKDVMQEDIGQERADHALNARFRDDGVSFGSRATSRLRLSGHAVFRIVQPSFRFGPVLPAAEWFSDHGLGGKAAYSREA